MIGSGPGPVGLAAAPVGWRSDSLAITDTWNTLTLDIGVSRHHLTKAGVVIGAPTPTATYRLERSNRSGAWKTVITVLSVERPARFAFTGAIVAPPPFPVARLEDDEDGTPVRVYDTAGRLLKSPAAAAFGPALFSSFTPARSVGRAWIESFVATTAGKAGRLQQFERRFGPGTPAGAWTRYSRIDGDLSQEVLVDPRLAIPVQEHTRRSGTLTSRRTIDYGPAPDDAVVRTAIHSETWAASGADDRAVADATFSNIRLERR